MELRFDYAKAAPGVLRALADVEVYLHTCGLEESLLNLVRLRASQMNGCAFCIDMHWNGSSFSLDMEWKELRALCESEERFNGLDIWRTSPYNAYYSERERAALAWAEAVTLVASTHVPDSVYNEVRPYFSDKEMSDLTLAIASINSWNRLSIASRREATIYEAAQYQEQKRAS
jgi:alkylhydroperoxidase family enzyme